LAEFEGVDLVAALLFPGVPLTKASVWVDSALSFVGVSVGVEVLGPAPAETGLSLFFVATLLGVSADVFSDLLLAL
jgi:hypothetical protein